MLPPLIAGKEKACFAVTEPNAGLDTTQLQDAGRARRRRLRRHGQKIWISTAQVADKMLLLARTTPSRKCKKADRRPHAVLHRLSTAATSRCARSRRWAARRSTPTRCSSTACRCRVEDRIGEEGKGFHYILHGMNPERILIAAEAVGHRQGRAARAPRIRQGARRVRPADRPEPGDPASAGRELDGARGSQPDDASRRRGSTTPASRAARRPTRPNISPPRRLTRPARARS